MQKTFRLILGLMMILALMVGFSSPSMAVLQAVSPTIAPGPGTGLTGYPLWYQDTNGLTLELCNFNNGLCLLEPPIDPVLGVGGETFWWLGEATVTFGANVGMLIMGMEGAFIGEDPVDGEQVAFGRLRIRIDITEPGLYTITNPFSVHVFDITAADVAASGGIRTVNISEDIGIATPGVFTNALSATIGPFLYWDTGLPILDPAGVVGDNFYIGDVATLHKVLGSPNGTNYFRIEKDGALVAETDLFVIMGKVFTGLGNTAPTVLDDAGATSLETPVDVDVLINDTFLDI